MGRWKVITKLLMLIPILWVLFVVLLFGLLIFDGQIDKKSFARLSRNWDVKDTDDLEFQQHLEHLEKDTIYKEEHSYNGDYLS